MSILKTVSIKRGNMFLSTLNGIKVSNGLLVAPAALPA